MNMPHQVPPVIKTGDSITHLHIQDIPLLTDQIYQRSEISKLYPSTVICS